MPGFEITALQFRRLELRYIAYHHFSFKILPEKKGQN